MPNEYLPGCPLGLLALHPAAPLEVHDLDRSYKSHVPTLTDKSYCISS